MDISFDSIFAQLAGLRDKSDNTFPKGEADNLILGDWASNEPKDLKNMDWVQPGVFLSCDPNSGTLVKAARETLTCVRFEFSETSNAAWMALEFKLKPDVIKKRGNLAFCISGATNSRTAITPCLRIFKSEGGFEDHFRPSFIFTHVEESKGDVIICDLSDIGEQPPRLIFFIHPKNVMFYLTQVQIW